MINPGRTLILGAGPTGLGAAHRFRELGFDNYIIVEASATPGGLSASRRDPQGFTWDLGSHVHFSRYPYYHEVLDRVLPANEWTRHERKAWVWLEEGLVPYPIQANVCQLPPAIRDRVKGELAQHRSADPPANFAQWLVQTFGPTLSEVFMYPYNEKAWGYPAERLAFNWTADRVSPPSNERGRDDARWGPNNQFRFPRHGTGSLWQAVARQLDPSRIAYGEKVCEIDLGRRLIRSETGQHWTYDTVITTVPLDVISGLCRGLLPTSIRAAAGLMHSSVHVVGVGLRGGRTPWSSGKSWVYFPQADIPFHRLTVFSDYSPSLVPDPDYWSLLLEVSETPHKPVAAAQLPSAVLEALRRIGCLGPDADVISIWHERVEHGYPTPSLNRDDGVRVILADLEAHDVYSRGRFGGWKYEVSNQDHCFMQGVEVVNRLLLDEPETVFR